LKEIIGPDKMKSSLLYDLWAEIFFFIIMLVGVVVALTAGSVIISYAVILIAGLLAGRILKGGETRLGFPVYMLVTGFLIGFLIGSYSHNKIIIILLYVIGIVSGHYVFSKGLLHDIRF